MIRKLLVAVIFLVIGYIAQQTGFEVLSLTGSITMAFWGGMIALLTSTFVASLIWELSRCAIGEW